MLNRRTPSVTREPFLEATPSSVYITSEAMPFANDMAVTKTPSASDGIQRPVWLRPSCHSLDDASSATWRPHSVKLFVIKDATRAATAASFESSNAAIFPRAAPPATAPNRRANRNISSSPFIGDPILPASPCAAWVVLPLALGTVSCWFRSNFLDHPRPRIKHTVTAVNNMAFNAISAKFRGRKRSSRTSPSMAAGGQSLGPVRLGVMPQHATPNKRYMTTYATATAMTSTMVMVAGAHRCLWGGPSRPLFGSGVWLAAGVLIIVRGRCGGDEGSARLAR